jgi:drug/metabolite transporter (DMT)-like permease
MLGAACAAAYLVVGRGLREALPLVPYLAAVNGVAGSLLLAAALATGATMLGLPATAYVAIAVAAVISSVLGHTLINASARRVPVHLVSLAILGEPVIASTLTWLAFGERPPPHTALGGAILLVGILVGFVKLRPPPAVVAATEEEIAP